MPDVQIDIHMPSCGVHIVAKPTRKIILVPVQMDAMENHLLMIPPAVTMMNMKCALVLKGARTGEVYHEFDSDNHSPFVSIGGDLPV